MESAGAEVGSPVWLAELEAVDLPFDGDRKAALAALRTSFASEPIDVNVVAGEGRRKKLLLADMDSTMIGQECIDELADAVGRRAEVAAVTERAMRGEIAFEPALRERVALFKGLAATLPEGILASRITINPGARQLVTTMRAHGAHTVLITGGFSSFAGPIAGRIGFDAWRANTLAVANGSLTGLVDEPVLGRNAKELALKELTAKLGLTLAETLAVGDGANDLGMIAHAGLGVAYRGKPALRAAANAEIDHADLTGLLFLQGFRRDEFAVRP